jgi:hypothetical protein
VAAAASNKQQPNYLLLPLADIDINKGQIPDVPPNPRRTSPTKIRKLMNSILQDPEMLELRALLVYRYGGRYVTIGGNMRLLAMQRLQYTTAPCIVIPEDTPARKLKNYIVKDNGSFGDWDIDMLLESYDSRELEEWAIDVQAMLENRKEERVFAGASAWNNKERPEARCNLQEQIEFHEKGALSYISFYRSTEEGALLTDIKADAACVEMFAVMAERILRKMIGLRITDGWCILTTPKRRHKELNFAERVCLNLSERLGLTFHKEAVTAKNRTRINPEFSLAYPIEENNIILFDDIVTTGSTLEATHLLLNHKNVICLVGIANR